MAILPLPRLARASTLLAFALSSGGCCLSVGAPVPGEDSGGDGTAGTATSGQSSSGGPTTGGSATAGHCGAYPNPLDFGPTLINTVASRSVTLMNCNTAALNPLTTTLSGTDAVLFTLSNIPSSLGPGDSATLDVSYAPISIETSSLAIVTFQGPNHEEAVLNLVGEPIGCAATLSPNPIDVGFVEPGSSGVACTTLGNGCNVALILSEVDFSTPDGPFSLSQTEGTALPVTLPGGGSAKVCFSYVAPTSGQISSETVTFVLEGWNGLNPTMTLTL